MNVGDLVVATDGPFIGMMGLITHIPTMGQRFHAIATVMWRNGDHQAGVSTKYLEIVK